MNFNVSAMKETQMANILFCFEYYLPLKLDYILN